MLATLAAAFLAGCAANSGSCRLGTAADLPVTTADHAYFTDIVINGGTAHMRIDTGAFANLLSDAAASRLNMTQRMLPGATVRGVGGARLVNLAVADSVQLGAAHGGHLMFITAATDTFPPGTDGLLGMDFLAKYDDDLDFRGGHLRLVDTGGDCTLPASPLPLPVYGVRLGHAGRSESPSIQVEINGVQLTAIVDTGATNSLLFRPAAERLGLPVDRILAAQSTRIKGVGAEPARGVFGRLRVPVQIGALSISNMPVTIADQASGDAVDMLLGYDFVALVHVWVSHSSHTLLLQYPALPTPVAAQ